MPSAEEITRHHDPNPDEDPWVHGPPPPTTVTLVAYDPSWPDRLAALAGDILAALGDVVLDIDHVGSTAVPTWPQRTSSTSFSRLPTRDRTKPTYPLSKPSGGST
jgi:GrpB protein